MDKIVGKIPLRTYFLFLFFIFCSSMIDCSQLQLKVTTLEGEHLDKAIVGQPFVLEAIISNLYDSQNKPIISEQENVFIKHFGLQMVTINGVSTITHKYRVRIDAAGQYTLGPAQFPSKGTMLQSNSIQVAAVEQSQIPASTSKKTSQNTGAFLKLSTDREHVVVGQKITATLRFYYSNDVTNLAPINQQKITGFSAPGVMRTNRGVEKVHGKEYNYLEVSWDMIPTEPGKKVIPAYYADYTVRTQQNNFMAHLSLFINNLGEQKRVYSNALTIIVDPLPPFKGEVHAVGSFSQFNAHIDPSVAKQGEGIVMTLELEGEGTLEKKHAVLSLKLPESFKYYDSKNYSTQTQSGLPKQHFEYIVQGLEKGTWEIPAQEFTFFDIERHKYKTLHTQPLSVTILQGAIDKGISKQKDEDKIEAPVQESVDQIRPLKWSLDTQTSPLYIPWWLLCIVAFIPIGVCIYTYIKTRLHNRFIGSKSYIIKKTRHQLQKIIKHKQYAKIYPLFIELFTKIFNIPESELTQEVIARMLQQGGFTEQELMQWNQFFNQMSEYSFFNKVPGAHDIGALENYAYVWLTKFEKML